MTDRANLRHAYGSAQDIPGLLEQAAPDIGSPVWTDLWSRLCHQGTVYSASFAALPALTDMARQWSTADRVMPVILAAAIVASTDRQFVDEDPRVTHAAEINELIGLTEQALHNPGLSQEPSIYIYLLQSLLGLEGVEVWGEWLDGINDEEYEVSCPNWYEELRCIRQLRTLHHARQHVHEQGRGRAHPAAAQTTARPRAAR